MWQENKLKFVLEFFQQFNRLQFQEYFLLSSTKKKKGMSEDSLKCEKKGNETLLINGCG